MTKWMSRYARRERIGDDNLTEAIERAERGLVDADLGGGVISRESREQGKAARAVFAY